MTDTDKLAEYRARAGVQIKDGTSPRNTELDRDMSELMPCPCRFCESLEVRVSFVRVFDECHYVACLECHANGPHKDTEAEAITAWNTRAGKTYAQGIEDAAKAAELFIIEGNSIHPDIPAEGMSEQARMIAHTTCQHVAEAIRALKGE